MTVSRVLTTVAACLGIAEGLALPMQRRQLNFDYNDSKVRGVNLGGWFVLEPWITPSIFEATASYGYVVDEYTYTQALGTAEATNRLTAHWGSWITEDDFAEIASFGLNHVRIPIGYWALNPIDGDPYIQGQLPYLDQAIVWARTYGIKVMLDLHGAPGSQNGFDNSGKKGDIEWQTGDTIAQTLVAIQNLANRYQYDTDVVTAIELLNEPAGYSSSINLDTLKQYYYDGWGNVRNTNAYTAVTIHDAFQDPVTYWNGFMNTASGVNDIILDTHIYQIFSDAEVARTPDEHIAFTCTQGPPLATTDKWLVVGEWTGAQTDCAQWLNGYGIGARYDGTYSGSSYVGSCDGKYSGTVDGLSDDDKYNLAHFLEVQLDAYELHTGWIFWAWKNEAAPEWHFQNLTRAGLIPQPLTSRQFGDQCS